MGIKNTDMRTSLVILNLLLIAVLFADQAGAQGVEPGKVAAPGYQFSLQLKNTTKHKLVFLVVGETLDYKLRFSTHFVTGEITGITNSTISLESRETGRGVFRHKDLAALKIPKSSRKKAIGHILMVGGAWILVGVTVNPAEESSTFLNFLAYPVGLYAVIKGYSIKREEKINLDDSWSWTLKEIKVIETIERGSFIKIILKSGAIIEDMKVDKVESEQIKGVEISQDSHEQFVYTSRTIGVSEIETLIVKKR